MVRFFVTPDEMISDDIILTGENAAHAKVLRLKAGEQVLVCDGCGHECLCNVVSVSGPELHLFVSSRQPSTSEAGVKVSIYIAFPKSDKLEHVIQKATELGAYEIVAFPSARCVSNPDDKSIKKKLERWQKIAASAAEQSGRGIIPQVHVLSSFQSALERAVKADLPIMFYENEHATTLRMALESGTNEIPYEGIYHLHPGEAVVPKKYNPSLGNGGSEEMNAKMDTLIELMSNMNFTNVVNIGNKKVYEGQQAYNKMRQNKYGTTNLY